MHEFDDTVAMVWSLTNNLKDDPYLVRYTKKKWSCTCPHFLFRKATCKHILSVRSKDDSVLSDDRFKITDYGKRILNIK